MGVRKLSREEARRITIRAQLLGAERPTDLLTVVEQLTFLQLDPTAAIAPSSWARIVIRRASSRLSLRTPTRQRAARNSSTRFVSRVAASAS